MIGSIELKKHYGSNDKILVRIFKHPAGKDGFDYSFGIFIGGPYSYYTDYSGWLIFYSCATDYSGFGGSNLAYAKEFFDEYKDDIELREIIVSKQLFKEYIIEKSVANEGTGFGKDLDEGKKENDEYLDDGLLDNRTKIIESFDKQDVAQFVGTVKGKFFEYVFFKFTHDSNKYKELKCDSKNCGQIDCIGLNDDGIDVFECKYSLHLDKLGEDINQILKKRDELIKQTELKVTPYLIIYKKIDNGLRTRL